MFITWDHYRDWLEDQLFDPQQVFPDVDIPNPSDFHTDSRSIKAGHWFIPLRGEKFDGHLFIRQSLKAGAVGFLYEPASFPSDSPTTLSRGIPVKDTLKALQAIAHGWRQELENLKLIALTGSVGKTTTKNYLGAILSTAGNCFVSPSSYNNEIGTPLSILKITEAHKFAILEMGARHVGDIRFLAEMALPNVAATLNVGSSHIGEFGGKEALLRTKSEMFHNSPVAAKLVVFHDQPELLNEAIKTGKEYISFGRSADAHVRMIDGVTVEEGKIVFNLEIAGNLAKFSMSSLSAAAPQNAAAACAMALACGIPVDKMQTGLANFQPQSGRFRPIKLKNCLLIDDAYNANPESMSSGLASIQQFFPNYQKGLVIGDMLELGPQSKQAHFEIGTQISKISGLAFVWVVGSDSKEFMRGAIEGGVDPKIFTHFSKVEDAMSMNLPLSSTNNPLVYIKASFGTGLHKLVAHLEKGM